MSVPREDLKKPRRLALFRDAQFGHAIALELHGKEENYSPEVDGYTRVTEWQTVTFKPLSTEAVNGAELTALSTLRAKTVDEFKKKLDSIDGRMANLRALAGPAAEVQP